MRLLADGVEVEQLSRECRRIEMIAEMWNRSIMDRMTATAPPPGRVCISRGCLDFGARCKVTLDDAGKAVTLAYGVRLVSGAILLDAKLLHFVVDGKEVMNPVGMECERPETYVELTTGAQ